jgi:hypothetical protein
MPTTLNRRTRSGICDYHPPKINAIIRTPGNERLVSAGDLDATGCETQPKSFSGATTPCAMEGGRPAVKGDLFCDDCRRDVDSRKQIT